MSASLSVPTAASPDVVQPTTWFSGTLATPVLRRCESAFRRGCDLDSGLRSQIASIRIQSTTQRRSESNGLDRVDRNPIRSLCIAACANSTFASWIWARAKARRNQGQAKASGLSMAWAQIFTGYYLEFLACFVPKRQGSARAAREGFHSSRIHLGFEKSLSLVHFNLRWGYFLKPWLDWPGLAWEIPSQKPGPWQANEMPWPGFLA
ncbi:hypothetical protein DFH09DRAFT_1275636 [Mycena vulgaris]|nr:hypothetical protein DFH09DRAFT_1275636 [Mycena vulgaris]